ncbi:hypothetical protein MKZ38_002916 [Zalerion maritima]|uniref:Uncharacterized protein n=1 Tax=Zalerion maritima TaxID=339359 RepID=A0AAD5RPM7_9PEZI|nr:hypothetical protein MKZ38_002916 [Zalerion maritima]
MSQRRPANRPASPASRRTPRPTADDIIAQRLKQGGQKVKFRRYVVSGAMTMVIIAGAWYGASLKTEQDIEKQRKKVYEATDQELIEHLTIMKNKHQRTKTELDKKLSVVRGRMTENAKREAEERGEFATPSHAPLPAPKSLDTDGQNGKGSIGRWFSWGGKG